MQTTLPPLVDQNAFFFGRFELKPRHCENCQGLNETSVSAPLYWVETEQQALHPEIDSWF